MKFRVLVLLYLAGFTLAYYQQAMKAHQYSRAYESARSEYEAHLRTESKRISNHYRCYMKQAGIGQ